MGRIRKADGDAIRSHVRNVRGSTDGRDAQSAIPAMSSRRGRKPRTAAAVFILPDAVKPPPPGYVAKVYSDARGRITRVDYVRA
jgi:hypothetical protein